jgi:hypothetical protein
MDNQRDINDICNELGIEYKIYTFMSMSFRSINIEIKWVDEIFKSQIHISEYEFKRTNMELLEKHIIKRDFENTIQHIIPLKKMGEKIIYDNLVVSK